MAAETQYTINTGFATINTANSNLDGSGSVTTVLTAASNGTKIKSVTIKAVGSTTAEGMVRLYIYDGANTRLFAEVHVPIVTQTASDACFEYFMELDLDLKSGYLLKASTQIANTFNIIAEGLDWAYYSSDVRPNSINYTANTGVGVISTANTNLDGTGTVVTILTAGSSSTYKGCEINSITIEAIASTTVDGMVRLFIQDSGGSNTKLFQEVRVPIVTQNSTNRSFSHQILFPEGYNIQAGYKIIASTEKSNTFAITIEGKDWKYPTVSTLGLFAKNLTPVSGTTTTSEEILHSHQISAAMVASGDMLEIYAALGVSAGGGTKTFRMYVNTANSLTAATQIAQVTASNATSHFSRSCPVISDTALECYGTLAAVADQYNAGSTTASSNITVPSVSAGFWIIISGQKSTGSDTDTVRWSMVRNSRI